MDEYEEAVLFTYALLESRLARLEYILGGTKKQADENPRPLAERILRIERSLQDVSAKSALLGHVKELVSKHSDLVSKLPHVSEDEEGSALDAAQKSAMVVERAPAFATAASQLKALDDQQIPQTDGFTKLAKLRPRIAEAEEKHLQQALQISMLRRRSGLLTSRVKQVHSLGQARCWMEWNERLQKAEQSVVRSEFRLRQEDD
ncbi:hypothetical protein EJ04DRAFT_538231 [Polyplosphaeria fusca]|uniref:Nuclear distribution protein n=1 Tax=Polyplosphaeria fusca TaxID=682080 RepID=A0A9P4UUD0_9PLEO|nr:hypothetical protein EJ04DRAFT_538231 [Polyplosphaeria fusca]